MNALLERGATQAVRGELEPPQAMISQLARACRSARRGLLICGPIPPSQTEDLQPIAALAVALGFPILCEAPSQLRLALPDSRLEHLVCDGFDFLYGARNAPAEIEPDLILQLGPPLTSGSVERYLGAHPTLERHLIAACGWPDPASSAASLLNVGLAAAAAALSAALEREPDRHPELRAAWQSRIGALNALAWQSVERELGAEQVLSEGGAVRVVVDMLPPGSLLAIGNSLPIREVDAFCRARAGALRVCFQRGANGIDGLISSAVGAAISAGQPTTLLIGDVSFLHDIGGLFAARALKTPLVIVVLNNDGGRIFEQLPLAALPDVTETDLAPWLTPHGLEFGHAAALYGHAYARVTHAEELRSALRSAQSLCGCSLIEVIVPPHGAAALTRRIRERLEAELAAFEGSETRALS